MTEKERYHKDVDEIAASGMRKLEASDIMNSVGVHTSPKKLGAVLIAAILFVLMVAGAYAADIGGFRRTVQLWLYGEQVELTVSGVEGTYQIENFDGEVIQSGGGVAIESDGHERPLTEEEIMEALEHEHPTIETIDGKMMLYFRDQAMDLTDQFVNDLFRIKFPDKDGMTFYVTVRSDGAYSVSNEGFVDP